MMKLSGNVVAVVIGLMLSVVVVATVGTSMAQTKSAPAPGQAPAPQVPAPGMPGDARQVQGTIQNVTGDMVTLADGTELMIPASLSVSRDDLKPGASVKASYEEKGSQKVVTAIHVEPSR